MRTPATADLVVAKLAILLSAAFVTTQELSVSGCKSLNDIDIAHCQQQQCYCYDTKRSGHPIHIWSSVQVRINSTGTFKVVHISSGTNCQYPETIGVFVRCLIQDLWQERESNETHIYINEADERVCFRIQTSKERAPYTLRVQRNQFDKKLFLVFCTGIFLFCYADTLSRNATVYYSAGITVGIVATLVFLLLIFKRFISKHNTFLVLMTGSWISSAYFIHFLRENIHWLWHENQKYLFGYFLVVGFVSFAICYRNGPLTDERSIHLLTWTLQLIGCLLIYFGVSIPEASYALIAILVCSKVLHYPTRGFYYLGRKLIKYLKLKQGNKLLTEEEYRDQAEAETAKALEELRLSCASPDFPSWLIVTRLHNPHKFAKFVLGSYHLSEKEISDYDEQYGPGGLILEEELFSSEREPEQDQRVDSIHDQEEPEEHQQNDVAPQDDTELFYVTNILAP